MFSSHHGARFHPIKSLAGIGHWPKTRPLVYELASNLDERSLHGRKEEVDMFGLANERRPHFQ